MWLYIGKLSLQYDLGKMKTVGGENISFDWMSKMTKSNKSGGELDFIMGRRLN